MNETLTRTIVALGLAATGLLLLFLHLEIVVLGAAITGVVFDFLYINFSDDSINLLLPTLIVLVPVVSCLFSLYSCYQEQPLLVIGLVTLVQLSDVLQYFAGRRFGVTRIGWISPKKTLEGYAAAIGVLFLSVTVLMPGYTLDSLVVLLLGITGGIVNSIVKRTLGIKDWSPLLGSHGGFLDRTDSIYLPSLYLAWRLR